MPLTKQFSRAIILIVLCSFVIQPLSAIAAPENDKGESVKRSAQVLAGVAGGAIALQLGAIAMDAFFTTEGPATCAAAATAGSAGATAGTGAGTAASLLSVPVIDTLNLAAKAADAASAAILRCSGAVKQGTQTGAVWWEKIKTKLLDPLVRIIIRNVIKEVKRMVMNYIITGEFGKPKFIVNFRLNAQQIAQNAARSFASQVFRIDFCNFNPVPVQATYPININFQLQCNVNSNLYKQLVSNPIPPITEFERVILAADPSSNYIQSIIYLGQTKAETLAQALISNAAETATGFAGETVKEIFGPSQAEAAKRTAEKSETARQEAMGRAGAGIPNAQDLQILRDKTANETFQDVLANCAKSGRSDCDSPTFIERANQAKSDAEDKFMTRDFTDNPITLDEAQYIGNAAANEVEAIAPRPEMIDKITTPGSTIKDIVSDTFASEWFGATEAKEFDQAVWDVVDLAVGTMVNAGLSEMFK